MPKRRWSLFSRARAAMKAAMRDPARLLSRTGRGMPYYQDKWKTKRQPTPVELLDLFLEVAFRCSILNANAVAMTNLRLFAVTPRSGRKNFATKSVSRQHRAWLAKQRTGRKALAATSTDSLVEVLEHPVLDLLNTVSDHFDGFNLIQLHQLYMEIVGRNIWMIEDGPLNMPAKIWPLPSHRLKPVKSPTKIIEGYRIDGNQKTIPLEELIVFRNPSPHDPYLEVWSPTRAAAQSLGLLDLDLGLAWSMMMSRARPDAWLSPKEGFGLDEDEADRLFDRFQQLWKQGANGGMVVVDTPVDIKQIGYTMRELDQIKRVDLQQDRVYNTFDVPVALGTKNTNKANLEAALFQHAKYAVFPRMVSFCQAINQQLLPRWDDRLFMWFDSPIPKDEERQSKIRESMLRTGQRTINDLREEDGLDPVAWGAEPWLPSSTRQPSDEPAPVVKPQPDITPVDNEDQADNKKSADTPERRLFVYDVLTELQVGDTTRTAAVKSLVTGGASASEALDWTRRAPPPGPPEDSHGHKTSTREDRDLPSGRAIREVLVKYFEEQRRGLLGTIRKRMEFPRVDLGATIDLSALGWDEELARRAKPAMSIQWDAAGKETISRLGVGTWDLASPGVQESLDKAAFDFSVSTNATTSLELNTAIGKLKSDLAAGIVTGTNTPAELSRIVQGTFDKASKQRAKRIALTESSRATHAGQKAAAEMSGVVTGFKWLLSSDPCPFCIEIEARNRKGIALNSTFGGASSFENGPKSASSSYENIPHPPAHPYCRCTLIEILAVEAPNPEAVAV